MKAIFIRPDTREVVLEENFKGGLQDIYDEIGCSRIDAASFHDSHDVIFVDDEGLFKTNREYFLIRMNGYTMGPFAGRGILVGTNIDTGDSVDPAISVETLTQRIVFLDETSIRFYLQPQALNIEKRGKILREIDHILSYICLPDAVVNGVSAIGENGHQHHFVLEDLDITDEFIRFFMDLRSKYS